MSPRLRNLLIVTGLVLLLAFGFFFLRGPKPSIEIKAETLWTIGGIKITNTLFTSWIVVVTLIAVALLATRRMSWIPSGLQNGAEAVVEVLYNLVVSTAGEKHARRFFPVIATIFLYIIVSNWFALLPIFNAIGKVEPLGPDKQAFHEEVVIFKDNGLPMIMPGSKAVTVNVDEAPCNGLAKSEHATCLTQQREKAIAEVSVKKHLTGNEKVGVLAPYFRSVNTDLMSPLSLALVSTIFVEFWGISTLGFFTYMGKFFNVSRLMKGQPLGIIDFFVGFLEFIAEVARVISFTFRLFGNLLAGEILLLVMTFLIPLLLALPFYGLELFVGAIQAFVFAMLTLVFGTLAVAGHGDEHAAEGPGQTTIGATAAH